MISSRQPIVSRVTDAERFSRESACGQTAAKKKQKHRKQHDPIVHDSQLDDRANRRSRQHTLNQFHESAKTITLAPGINPSQVRYSNNLLVTAEETKSRSTTNMKVYSSCGGSDGADATMYRLLKSGQQVVNEENITPQAVSDVPRIHGGFGESHSYNASYKDHFTTHQPTTTAGAAGTSTVAAPGLPALPQLETNPDGSFDCEGSFEDFDNDVVGRIGE